MRKDFLAWSVNELERTISRLLDNMGYADIHIQGATRTATAYTTERVSWGGQSATIRLDLQIVWSEQSDGLTVIVTAQETQCEWTTCLTNRVASSVMGALRTLWELEHGNDG